MSDLLRIPMFRRLYAAHVIHIIGNEFTFIAIVGLLNDLSGSGLSFAAATVCRLVPYVLTSFFAGALLERWDKKTVMVAVNLARGILVSLFFWVTDPSQLWLAFALLIAMNIFGAFFTPAMQVAIVQSVEEPKRLAANSLLQGTTSLLIIICQGIAAFLVFLFSYRYNFLLDAACYFASMLLLLGLPAFGQAEGGVAGSFAERLRDGFRYVRQRREIRHVLGLQMAERFAASYYNLLMFYILQERGQGLYVFGLLDIPLGLGGVAAGLVAGKLASRLSDGELHKLKGAAMLVMGIAIWLIFHAGPYPVMVVAILAASFTSMLLIILTVTRLQRMAEAGYLARVFSLREMLTAGAFSFSSLAVGYAAEQAGSSPVAWGLAIWSIGSGLVWLAARRSFVQSQEAKDSSFER